MTEPQNYQALATGLANMARTLLAQSSPQQTLDEVVAHAVSLVDGCEAAGILSVRRDGAETLAATDDVVRASDRNQAELGEGPCFDAAAEGTRVYRIKDTHQPVERWPLFVKRARELGIGSMMGFLLYTKEQDNLGALNLYSARRDAFPPNAEHVGWVMASHAAVGLAAARHAESMDYALASSRLIGEAVGVVMSRYALAEEQAFDRIRKASQHNNVKVRALAEVITAIGEIPTGIQIRDYLNRSGLSGTT